MRPRIYPKANGRFRVVWQATRTVATREEAEQLAELPYPPPSQGQAAISNELRTRIRRLRDEGKTPGEIAGHLNRENVPTGRGGKRWWPATVRQVLNYEPPPAGAPGIAVILMLEERPLIMELGADTPADIARLQDWIRQNPQAVILLKHAFDLAWGSGGEAAA